jgi:hypothetical protein
LVGLSTLKLEHLNLRHNALVSEETLNILQLLGDDLK